MTRRQRPTLNLNDEKIDQALDESKALTSSAFSSSALSSHSTEQLRRPKAGSAAEIRPPHVPVEQKGPVSTRPGVESVFQQLKKVKEIEEPQPRVPEPEPAPAEKKEEKEAETEEEDQEGEPEAETHENKTQPKSGAGKPTKKLPGKKKKNKNKGKGSGGGPRRMVSGGSAGTRKLSQKPGRSSNTPSERSHQVEQTQETPPEEGHAISAVEQRPEAPSEQRPAISAVEQRPEAPSEQRPAIRAVERKREALFEQESEREREIRERYEQSHPIERPPAHVRRPHPSPKVKTAEQHHQEFEARKQRENEIANACLADLQTLRQNHRASYLENLARRASNYHSPTYNGQFVPGPIDVSKILKSCGLARD